MGRRPLAHDLGIDARIGDLVGGGAGEMIGRDVAHAIAGGLDRMHLDLGERLQHVRHVLQRDPVELQVLARGEMAVIAVPAPADHGELAQLPGRQRAVGDGDPQHIGVELKVDAVHQAQRLELVLGDLALEAPRHLVAELRDPRLDEGVVELVITVERAHYSAASSSSAGA